MSSKTKVNQIEACGVEEDVVGLTLKPLFWL